MDVEKVFWTQPYLRELEAVVTGVDGEWVTVDRTILFAFSGGQESDCGTIGGYEVLEAKKCGKQIFYRLGKNDLQTGEKVLQRIAWERRYKLMRGHFAAELVLELVGQNFTRPEKIGAHIAEDKARIDFVWAGNIAETFVLLQEKLQQIIADDLPIESEFSDVASEERYWKIDGFAKVLCGGTHIKRTGEVGDVLLKRNNIGKGKERIELHCM